MRESGSISFGFTAGAKKSQRRTGHHPRSHIKNVSKHYVPRSMKNFLQILPIALCGLAGTAFADDFKSMVITSGVSADLPPIHGDQFMVIRNFTQDDGSPRGVVTVTKPPNGGTSVNVLAAAVLDASPPDVINSVVIAGPADVSVTCGTTTGNCFISYRKDSN